MQAGQVFHIADTENHFGMKGANSPDQQFRPFALNDRKDETMKHGRQGRNPKTNTYPSKFMWYAPLAWSWCGKILHGFGGFAYGV